MSLNTVRISVEGIDNARAAFIGLLQGKNFGKLIIKLGPDPTR